MNSLYLLVDLATLFFPIVLSFDKKVAFYKSWKYAFTTAIITGIPFLIWYSYFTTNGIWGFNREYLIGITFVNLPLEEILFFIVVPFSCTFIYCCCKTFLAHVTFRRFNAIFYVLITIYIALIICFGWKRSYAQAVVLSASSTLLLLYLFRKQITYLPVAFLFSLLPFFIVNGILTGSFTPAPVVWYNPADLLPFRIFTIPVEDVLYSFTLTGLTVCVFESLKNRGKQFPGNN